MGGDEQAIRELVETWNRATSAGDAAPLLKLMAEDVVFLTPGQPPMRGRDGFVAAFQAALKRFRIDPVSEVQEIQIAGDLGLLLDSHHGCHDTHQRWSSRATQRLHAYDFAQAGRRVGGRSRREYADGGCMKTWALLALAASALCAQTVQVYSEFAQINDTGEVVAPATPREILSPAVARNAFSSFQIAIQVPKGTKFLVYMGQNPDDAAKVTLYRRRAGKLEPIELPYSGESSQVLWMDLWLDANAPVRRVKIEPQVGIDGDWVTYPMEVRVMEPVVPDRPGPEEGVASAFEVMHVYLCGGKFRPIAGRVPIGAELVFRNAQQDVALAAAGSMPLREEMKKAMGGCNATPPADPEFYLRLRDYLFTPLWKKVR